MFIKCLLSNVSYFVSENVKWIFCTLSSYYYYGKRFSLLGCHNMINKSYQIMRQYFKMDNPPANLRYRWTLTSPFLDGD